MRSRNRAFQHDDDIKGSAPKHHQPEPSLPTPSSTASPKFQAPKQPSTAPYQSEPEPSKPPVATDRQPTDWQKGENPDCDLAPLRKRNRQSSTKPDGKRLRRSSESPSTWFLEDWLNTSVQEKAEGSVEIVPTIERPSSPPIQVSESRAASGQMSQQDGNTSVPGSAASTRSENLNVSSSLYRGTLKMNGIIIDNFGKEIPPDVQELVNKHIWKNRDSPPLGTDENSTIERIEKIWDSAEPALSSILETLLFPLRAPGIQEGGDTLWSTKPLPRNPDYQYALRAPKTDRHFGFPPTLMSTWTTAELSTADHFEVRPYSQPTRENLFPSFFIELKSEASGGTLYVAENQLAAAGAHRIQSLIWLLNKVNPLRKRSSADALVFSAAISQREAIAHVHYYNPEKKQFYMSFIRSFPFAMDVQGCHTYSKNIVDWLLNIQQPIIRELLLKLRPSIKAWKKGRSASTIADTDAAKSFTSEDGKRTKSQRTSEE